MPSLVASHAEAEIRNVMLSVGLPLIVMVLAASIGLAFKLRAGDGINRRARVTLILALLLAPVSYLAGILLVVFFPLLLIPLGVLGYSISAIRRVPSEGGKVSAIAAFAVSGVSVSLLAGDAVACLAVEGCGFH